MKRILANIAKVGAFVVLAAAIILIVNAVRTPDTGSASGRVGTEWVDVTDKNFVQEVVLSDRPTIIAVLYEQGNASEVMAPIYKQVSKDYPQIKFVRLLVVKDNLSLVKSLGLDVDFQPSLIVLNHAFTEKPAAIPGVYTKEMLEEELLPLTYAETLQKGKGIGEVLTGAPSAADENSTVNAPPAVDANKQPAKPAGKK